MTKRGRLVCGNTNDYNVSTILSPRNKFSKAGQLTSNTNLQTRNARLKSEPISEPSTTEQAWAI